MAYTSIELYTNIEFYTSIAFYTNIEFYTNILNNTQFRVRVREDWGCAVSPWSTIVNVPINFVSTPFISHN